MVSETDLAYTAGIIDGEGCISISKSTPTSGRDKYGYHYAMTVHVGICDADVPIWLYTTFGGSLKKYRPKALNNSPFYIWTTTSQMARRFLKSISPYLKLKQEQALVALTFQGLKTHRGRGGKPLALYNIEAILAQKLKELHKTHKEVDIGHFQQNPRQSCRDRL